MFRKEGRDILVPGVGLKRFQASRYFPSSDVFNSKISFVNRTCEVGLRPLRVPRSMPANGVEVPCIRSRCSWLLTQLSIAVITIKLIQRT